MYLNLLIFTCLHNISLVHTIHIIYIFTSKRVQCIIRSISFVYALNRALPKVQINFGRRVRLDEVVRAYHIIITDLFIQILYTYTYYVHCTHLQQVQCTRSMPCILCFVKCMRTNICKYCGCIQFLKKNLCRIVFQ